MKLKHFAIATLAFSLAAGTLAATKAEKAIKYREAIMTVNHHALVPLFEMAQGKIPYNKGVVERNSKILGLLIKLPWAEFGPGTEKGAPTRASMKIWSEQAKFKEAAQQVENAVAELDQAVAGGNESTVKHAVVKLGKACVACHREFRLKQPRG